MNSGDNSLLGWRRLLMQPFLVPHEQRRRFSALPLSLMNSGDDSLLGWRRLLMQPFLLQLPSPPPFSLTLGFD
jgi:hypothetical protein